jgi:hypothetical protein
MGTSSVDRRSRECEMEVKASLNVPGWYFRGEAASVWMESLWGKSAQVKVIKYVQKTTSNNKNIIPALPSDWI